MMKVPTSLRIKVTGRQGNRDTLACGDPVTTPRRVVLGVQTHRESAPTIDEMPTVCQHHPRIMAAHASNICPQRSRDGKRPHLRRAGAGSA